MAGKEDEGNAAAKGLILGGMATGFGVVIATLLAAKPAKAAPPEEKLDYLIEILTALVPVLAQVAESNAQLIELLQQWLAAQVPGAPGIEVTVLTPWVAKEPEQIFNQDIRVVGTFYSDKMVDWTKGKRFLLKVESSLNQTVTIQVIGNFIDNMTMASDINGPIDILANENHSVGLAWDDWHPFIGVRIITAVAPTAGILTIYAVKQE